MTLAVSPWVPFTDTLSKLVSIPVFGKINLAFGVLELYVKLDVKRECYIFAQGMLEALRKEKPDICF